MPFYSRGGGAGRGGGGGAYLDAINKVLSFQRAQSVRQSVASGTLLFNTGD